MIPSWALQKIKSALDTIPDVQWGKVYLSVELDYSGGGLGGIKTKVSIDETHRSPGSS